MSITSLTNKGDTIIEVLLAITVVSAVLGGAYVSANRSVNAGRQAQERAEATKYVEKQIESLKAVASSPSVNIYDGVPSQFCITGALLEVNATSPQCRQGTDSRYQISVERTGPNTFKIRNQWDRVGGGGTEQIEMFYRVYK